MSTYFHVAAQAHSLYKGDSEWFFFYADAELMLSRIGPIPPPPS